MTPIEISTDQDRLDVDMIHAYLANDSYWVPGILRSSVEKCIKHSLCFGAYADGRQIAFARIATGTADGTPAPASRAGAVRQRGTLRV
jgi:hypothetical protein